MQKIGLASIHGHPAIIPSGQLGQVHPGRHAPPVETAAAAPPVVPPKSGGIGLLLRHGTDKILRFLRGIEASLFSFVP